MRTIRTKVYQFSELSKAAQSKAVEAMRDVNVDYYWYMPTFEDAKDAGLKLGEFDLDSASFVRDLRGEFINNADFTANTIKKNHGKDCETYKTATDYLQAMQQIHLTAPKNKDGSFKNENAIDDKEADLQDAFLNNLLIDYTKILQEDLEYRSMDSAVIETLVENKYEFKQDGTRF